MNPNKPQFERLAFQADRRILSLEEETHLRLDILAHEAADALIPKKPRAKRNISFPDFSYIKDYSVKVGVIFALLFMASNMPTAYKVGMASVTDFNDQRLSQIEVQEGILLSKNIWEGDKSGENGPELLEAREEPEAIAPDDGIFAAIPTPSSHQDRLSIPSLDINAPLVQPALAKEALDSGDWNKLEDQIRESLLNGIVHYPGTANPGKKGNFFVTGHSSNVFWESSAYNSVFALLPRIEEGEEIIITKDQQEYVYVVTSKEEVSPNDVSVLKQGNDYKMTLMTCTPIGTTLKRLVVTAELK